MEKECENLTLYFYGELEPPRAAEFKKHLRVCPRCAAELLFLQRTQEALVPPAAPKTVVEGVLAPARQSGGGYLWQVLKPALATALVLGLGIYFFAAGPRMHGFIDEGKDLVASISAEADEEYNKFAQEFDAFENEFF